MVTDPRFEEAYIADGIMTIFPVTIEHVDDDVRVLLGDLEGVLVEQTKGVDWEYVASEVVFLLGPPTVDYTVVIQTDTEPTQELDLIINDPLPPEELEKALDKLTLLARQGERRAIGALTFPDYTEGPYYLPLAEGRASKLFFHDTEGWPIYADPVELYPYFDGLVEWKTGIDYPVGFLVAHDSYFWEAVAPVKDTPPGTNPDHWIRWTDQTTESTSASATIAPNRPNHYVMCDTSGGDITIDISDGQRIGDRVTIVAFGGNRVTVNALGATGFGVSGSAATFIWAGTQYVVSGGGGGGGGGLAVGDIVWWPSTTVEPPEATLRCDGSILNIADFNNLYAVLGTKWGGDGVTTFALPDFSGIVYDDPDLETIRGDQDGVYIIQTTATFSTISKVNTENIEDQAVTTPKIKDGAVTTAKLANDSVTSDKIPAGAVGSSEIADGSVGSAEIGDGQVGTSELADDSVTLAKLAPEILNFIYPVGYTYAQYPNGKSPSEMGWPGSWTEDFDGEGITFRTEESGVTEAFNGPVQLDAMQGHWHNVYYKDGKMSQSGGTTVQGHTVAADGHTVGDRDDRVRYPVTDGVNGTPRTDSETRMKNRTFKVWRRTA